MNTPDQTKYESNANVDQQRFDDQLQQQLIQHQTSRKRERDYARIFREYNTPAQWYQASPLPRSIYFYDPQYQRYLRQQSGLPMNSPRAYSPRHVASRSPSRAKPSKAHSPSRRSHSSRVRMQPSVLPPITTAKQVKDE
ncbi:unnamed protein product [Adineta ricciae]|nr:unnamed protein product [Adineta ricciae]